MVIRTTFLGKKNNKDKKETKRKTTKRIVTRQKLRAHVTSETQQKLTYTHYIKVSYFT